MVLTPTRFVSQEQSGVTDGPSVELWTIESRGGGGAKKIIVHPMYQNSISCVCYTSKHIRLAKAQDAQDLICNKNGRNLFKSMENETHIPLTISFFSFFLSSSVF